MLFAAILIELLGIAAVGIGIGMEMAHGGELYLVVITGGSCLVALGGVLFGKFFKVRGER